MTEPVQGAGGVHIPSVEYIQECKRVCEKYGILFIADEVITGFGRTGKHFGMEHFGVTPDIICFAKGVTSGYAQLGGVIISQKIHQDLIALSEGTFLHGYTYSGHPTACAVGLRNLRVLEEENLIGNVQRMGQELLNGLNWLKSQHSIVGEVRSIGLLGAIELVKDPVTNERFHQPISPEIVKEAEKRGLIIRSVVFDGQDTIVLSPPFVINKQEIHKMIEIISESLFRSARHHSKNGN